jgi:hypothetical protein
MNARAVELAALMPAFPYDDDEPEAEMVRQRMTG